MNAEHDNGPAAEVVRTAAKFASRHVAPAAAAADQGSPRFPEAVFGQGIRAGFDRLVLPEAAGGYGFRTANLYLSALIETLAEACAGHAMVFGVHAATLGALAAAATPAAAGCVAKVLESGRPLAVAIPDPAGAGGFDAPVAATPDGALRLAGAGALAWNVAEPGWLLLFAAGPGGTPLALLSEAGGATLAPGGPEPTLGLRAMPVRALRFESDAVPGTCRVAEGGGALALYGALISALALVVAAAACGLMKSAFVTARAYAGIRYQGGGLLIDHSHLRGILGQMAAAVTASQGALFHAATTGADGIVALGTKLSVTEQCVRVCVDAVQLLGGYGYMRDYGLEKAMRDAAMLSLLPVSNAQAEQLITALGIRRWAGEGEAR